MNLIYFEGKTAHIIGLYGVYHKTVGDKIEAKAIDDILILRKTQAPKAGVGRHYFSSVSSVMFLDFIRSYCESKRLDGLQFVEVKGVYYEMYGGDNIQVKRAIEYCKEITVLTLDGGNIIYHIDDEDDDD
ncbi:hypothetical protein SAMN02910317_01964 [Ruminococcaceae bacterium FB2012]|nr:hypothetical protein SAMN02910317_01964 [Ruminococcaceae bacterium FB2012]